MLPIYRARMEWDGVEIFDRVEGRAFRAEDGDEEYDIAPIINTPFPKSAAFCSAPRRVYWELTRRCNLNCANCYNRYANPGFAGEMNLDQCMDLSKTLYDNGVWIVQLTGGEPTVAPHVWDLVSFLKTLGFYVAMGTNGIFQDKTLDRAASSGVDWFIISMDGEHERSGHALVEKGFHAATDTAQVLARAGRRVRVNTLIQRDNYTYEQLAPLAGQCADLGIESLNCIPLRPYVQDHSALEKQLTREEFCIFVAALETLRLEYPALQFITTLDLRDTASLDRVYRKEKSCAAGREGCVISPFGEVYGCSYSLASTLDRNDPMREKYVAGDLHEREFMEIWNDSARWSVYRDLVRYKNEKCHRCAWYKQNRCIGSCPIMVRDVPDAFDPYCYVELDYHGPR